MPTYSYRRQDGSLFEIEQRITDSALETCPTTGQPITRVITSGAGLVFKGTGFYVTDYARKGSNGTASVPPSGSDTASDSSESKAEASPSKTESKDTSAGKSDSTPKSKPNDG
jgi:putative FmdB family regulatory protein